VNTFETAQETGADIQPKRARFFQLLVCGRDLLVQTSQRLSRGYGRVLALLNAVGRRHFSGSINPEVSGLLAKRRRSSRERR